MSAGTLIPLAAEEIVMTGHAVPGPVDPQLCQYPAASIPKAMAEKPVADVDDQTLMMADQSDKTITQVRESLRRDRGIPTGSLFAYLHDALTRLKIEDLAKKRRFPTK
jgi:membrane-bound ClpP family serine protease